MKEVLTFVNNLFNTIADIFGFDSEFLFRRAKDQCGIKIRLTSPIADKEKGTIILNHIGIDTLRKVRLKKNNNRDGRLRGGIHGIEDPLDFALSSLSQVKVLNRTYGLDSPPHTIGLGLVGCAGRSVE